MVKAHCFGWVCPFVWEVSSEAEGPVFESQALTLEVHPLETWAESTVCFNTGMGLALPVMEMSVCRIYRVS